MVGEQPTGDRILYNAYWLTHSWDEYGHLIRITHRDKYVHHIKQEEICPVYRS